jgi:hypothetical protein
LSRSVEIRGDRPSLPAAAAAAVESLEGRLCFAAAPAGFELAVAGQDRAPTLRAESTISINDIQRNEGNSGQTDFTFTVSRTNGFGTAKFDYVTANGSSQPMTCRSRWAASPSARA